MDGLTLAAVMAELQKLIGGKIDKVQQPEKDMLLLGVRANGGNTSLLLSASPVNCRAQLTGVKRENPQEPPVFCMLLRKRIVGARIAAVTQPSMDRVLTLSLEGQDDMGEPCRLFIACEIMGRHSNVIVYDGEGRVLDAIKHVGLSQSSVRQIMPGGVYTAPPPQDKRDPLTASAADLEAVFASERPQRALSAAFFGISPATAAVLTETYPSPALMAAFFADAARGVFSPCIGEDGEVYPFLIPNAIPAGSMSAALDEYYIRRDGEESLRRKTASTRKILENNVERLEKKLALYTDVMDEEHIDALRRYGELLTASLYALKGNTAEAAVTDYSADPPAEVVIPLDARVSPAENARRYFKKYRKAKAAREMAETMRADALGELGYIEGQLDDLDKCVSRGDLAELREELTEQGYIKRERGVRKAQKLPPSRPLRFTSADGIAICVGKNNRQNDRLTLKTAAPDNIWLHVKDMPGSHVIIDFHGLPPETTLRQAAALAAFYSRARGGENVPVDYAPARLVRKPAGARPGMVIYSGNRTLYVTPAEPHTAE